MARTDYLGAILSPTVRLVWGLTLILTMTLSGSWIVHSVLAIEGYLLARVAGKRISLLYFLFLTTTITAFSLLVPYGRILWRLGTFSLTEGALGEGLLKGITLGGLVFLSLASVSRQLAIPGRWGKLWAKTFTYYERLLEARHRLVSKHFFSSLDDVLEEQFPSTPDSPTTDSESGSTSDEPPPALSKTRASGWLLVGVTSLANLVMVWFFH